MQLYILFIKKMCRRTVSAKTAFLTQTICNFYLLPVKPRMFKFIKNALKYSDDCRFGFSAFVFNTNEL